MAIRLPPASASNIVLRDYRAKEGGGSVRESNPPETLLPPDRI